MASCHRAKVERERAATPKTDQRRRGLTHNSRAGNLKRMRSNCHRMENSSNSVGVITAQSGRKAKNPGVAAPLVSANCRGNFWYLQAVNVSVEMQRHVHFDSRGTVYHGGPTGSVHRQIRRCFSVLQHQVRSIRTVYIQTAQKTVEVVAATEFNDPEGRSRSTKCGSLTELLRYLLYCRGLLP